MLLAALDDLVSANEVVAMFAMAGNGLSAGTAGACGVNVCTRTCCDRDAMLSADSLMEAMDWVAARRSLLGKIRWNRSGDSSGLLTAEPSVAFTRNLRPIKETEARHIRGVYESSHRSECGKAKWGNLLEN